MNLDENVFTRFLREKELREKWMNVSVIRKSVNGLYLSLEGFRT